MAGLISRKKMNYQFDLSEIEFRLIRDFIHERFGIYLKDEMISFVSRNCVPTTY